MAIAVGQLLSEHGIRAVLTGGACATIYSEGAYVSDDIDFILEGRILPAELDRAMAAAGFAPRANRYVHAESPFWVEFPRGPLAVGGDLDVEPAYIGEPGNRTLALSPTDSVRDRLAAFYHWSDRQSLAVAVEIARRHPIDRKAIRRWSAAEGQLERYAEFLRELEGP